MSSDAKILRHEVEVEGVRARIKSYDNPRVMVETRGHRLSLTLEPHGQYSPRSMRLTLIELVHRLFEEEYAVTKIRKEGGRIEVEAVKVGGKWPRKPLDRLSECPVCNRPGPRSRSFNSSRHLSMECTACGLYMSVDLWRLCDDC